jgi:hypothetical protein
VKRDERPLALRWLGRVDYDEAHAVQRRLVDERIGGGGSDVVLPLEKIGFFWNTNDEVWQGNVALLKAFKRRERNLLVPVAPFENGVKLGMWLSSVRGKAARGNLPEDKRADLLKLGVKLPSEGSKGKRHGPSQLK